MSDLQIVLIALGALIIAGVVFYNWMQERKLHENISGEFIVPQKDVLTEEFYIDADAFIDKELADDPNKTRIAEKLKHIEPEPAPPLAEVVKAEPKPEAPSFSNSIAQTLNEIPVVSDKELSSPLSQAMRPEASSLPAELHPQVDLTALLFTSKSLAAEALVIATNNIVQEMGVPMMLHGLDKDGKWHAIDQSAPKGAFKQVACSIQLADRSGPVSKTKLNKFQFSVEDMGLELGAHVEWQGTGDALQRATDLDKFCMEVDQIVSIHLLQGDTPIHGTKFKGLAEANNLKLHDDGKFYLYPSDGHGVYPLLSVTSVDKQPFTAESLRKNVVKGAVFQIEIPKVAQCEQVFNQMFLLVQKMATTLNARVVDDNQKPLGDLQQEKIRQQLKVIHAKMVARGVMPGTAYSLRLFN
jgi:FtsZ-interacting cell division protein ZipA